MNRREYYRQASEAFHFVIYIILKGYCQREQANFEEICRNDKLSAFVEVENSPNHHGGFWE